MNTQILLVIWVIISVLILLLGIANSISIMTLENRIDKIDTSGSDSVWKILMKNWDVVVSAILVIILISSFLLSGVRNWYMSHKLITLVIFTSVISVCSTMIIIKRVKK